MKRAQTEWGDFTYFDADFIGARIASGQFWEEHLRPFLDEMGPGKVFVDAGANIGFFSVYCGLKGAEVHAFEACPEVAHLLLHNVQENKLTNIHVHEQALFDVACELAIMPDHDGWGGYPVLPNGRIDFEKMGNAGALGLSPLQEGDDRPYRMLALPLDYFDIQDVSLLKVDVQGADLRVLRGARQTIEQCKPTILFEYEPAPSKLLGNPFEDYQTFFESIEYRMDHIHAGDFVARPREKV